MDGNGRWAERRKLPRIEGHRHGADSVREITRAARSAGVERLTLYAFSEQNWGRPVAEVKGLMTLLRDYLIGERDEILGNDIRLRTIGEIDRLPGFVRRPLDRLVEDSAHCRSMDLSLALSYGGREELTRAIQRIARRVDGGQLRPEQINEALISEELGLADADLVIRTSGELRLSNFLLWQVAYAEFYFTETLWPDFRKDDFLRALECYGSRNRRFGLVSAA